MTHSTSLQQTALSLLRALRTYYLLWVIPTVLFTAAAVTYALVRPRVWQASQAMLVRDEAAALDRQGRFDSIDSMQAFQETLLEVARSPLVVTEALRQLGRPANLAPSKHWPSESDVESLQEEISVSAPKGAQFGRTEVIYLAVKGPTRDEALRRTHAVCDQLEKHLASLRKARAASVIRELQDACDLAQQDLDAATERLASMESEVGGDLAELRVLNQSGSGEGNLRIALNQIKAELRQVQAAYNAQQEHRAFLRHAQANPDALLATPNQLLESQPSLRRLKDGLVDAQLRTSNLRGKMSHDHPLVQAAIRAEAEVRQNLRHELATALKGQDSDLSITKRQLDSLTAQREDLQGRLDRLAGMRARYSLLVEDVQQRTNILEERKKKLSEARASQTASQSASLITRFQEPHSSDDPIGPGNTLIAAVGLFGGLLTGVGLVFLVAPVGPNARRRRLTDYLGLGRRSSDQTPRRTNTTQGAGRRADDQVPAAPASESNYGRRAEDTQQPPGERRKRRS